MNYTNYLCSPITFPGGKRNIISWSFLLLWLGIIIFISSYHEMWRDEVHCLYVALEPDSLWELPATLKNEGHPVLWYLILRLGFQLTQTPVILKIASISVAFMSVYLFFRYAPFQLWFKVLFLGTVLPMYEYSIMARNYGISMLLFYLFASLYSQRRERPYLLATVLFALAHTNIHSSILVCFLTCYWLYEDLMIDKSFMTNNAKIHLILSSSLVFLGVALAIMTVLPDKNSVVMQPPSFNITQILSAFWENMKHPGMHYDVIFYKIPCLARDILIWLFFLGLLVRPVAAVLFFGGTVVLGLFFSIGYNGVLRHQGIFFIFLLTMYWIVMLDLFDKPNLRQFFNPIFKAVLYIVLPFIFIIHIGGTYKKIHRDLTQEMSSNKAFGEFIQNNEQFHDAIIIGEPDIRLESLPYYVDNQIYIPREKRFANYVKLTRRNKQELTLGELLEAARTLKAKKKKPVLIALGHFGLLGQGPPFIRTEKYNKKFIWSLQELKDFQSSTIKIAEFKKDVKNERYEVYQLK